MNFVADTHALLWWFTDSPRISSNASVIFEKCEKGEGVIFIPSIVIAEALSIFDKKRVSFDFRNLFKEIKASENFVLILLRRSGDSIAAFCSGHLIVEQVKNLVPRPR